MKIFPGNEPWVRLLVLFGILAFINSIASVFHYRMDLTDEKRFTISNPVKKILKNLDDAVEIDVFLKGELPSGFKKLTGTTLDLLNEFKDYARGNVRYRLLSPDDLIPGSDRTYADTLTSLGIIPINLTVQVKQGERSQYVYPAAMVHYRDRIIPVRLYSGTKTIITPSELNSAEALLEYNFADAINKITNNRRPLIAYSTGNGEPSGVSTYDLVENVLRKNYDL
ncbi:MAG: Gldg family protein, partial [Ginsengibacter sp.]